MFEKIIIASELPKDMEVFIRSLGDLKKLVQKNALFCNALNLTICSVSSYRC